MKQPDTTTSAEPITAELLAELARARCPVRFTVFTGLNDLSFREEDGLDKELETVRKGGPT